MGKHKHKRIKWPDGKKWSELTSEERSARHSWLYQIRYKDKHKQSIYKNRYKDISSHENYKEYQKELYYKRKEKEDKRLTVEYIDVKDIYTGEIKRIFRNDYKNSTSFLKVINYYENRSKILRESAKRTRVKNKKNRNKTSSKELEKLALARIIKDAPKFRKYINELLLDYYKKHKKIGDKEVDK